MNNEIYINISILDLGNGTSEATLIQSINDGPLEITKLELNHAKRLLWELVLAGGRREYYSNRFDHTITRSSVYIFLPN